MSGSRTDTWVPEAKDLPGGSPYREGPRPPTYKVIDGSSSPSKIEELLNQYTQEGFNILMKLKRGGGYGPHIIMVRK